MSEAHAEVERMLAYERGRLAGIWEQGGLDAILDRVSWDIVRLKREVIMAEKRGQEMARP